MRKSNTKGIKIRFLLLLMWVAWTGMVHGVTKSEMKERLVEIKLDEAYIYGEGFGQEKAEASKKALSELLVYSNELRKERGLAPVNLRMLKDDIKTLGYKDGNRYDIVVYIPLDTLLSKEGISHASVLVPEASTAPEVQTNISETSESNLPNQDFSGEIIDFLINQDTWQEIRDYLIKLKDSGKISETGAEEYGGGVPEDAYLILIDDLGGILAVLSGEDSGERLNCKTLFPDNIDNYSDCKFIVWYR